MEKVSVCILCILFWGVSYTGSLQKKKSSVDYKIEFIQGSSQSLFQAAGNDGLAIEDFGRWFSNHASILKNTDGIKPENSLSSQLMLFVIDQRGSVVSQTSLALQVGSKADLLNRVINTGELTRSLNAVFVNQDCSISGDVIFRGEMLFPGGFLIGNLYESQSLAADAAGRAFRRLPGSEEGFALVILATPDIDEFDYSVDPGTAAFFCK